MDCRCCGDVAALPGWLPPSEWPSIEAVLERAVARMLAVEDALELVARFGKFVSDNGEEVIRSSVGGDDEGNESKRPDSELLRGRDGKEFGCEKAEKAVSTLSAIGDDVREKSGGGW